MYIKKLAAISTLCAILSATPLTALAAPIVSNVPHSPAASAKNTAGSAAQKASSAKTEVKTQASSAKTEVKTQTSSARTEAKTQASSAAQTAKEKAAAKEDAAAQKAAAKAQKAQDKAAAKALKAQDKAAAKAKKTEEKTTSAVQKTEAKTSAVQNTPRVLTEYDKLGHHFAVQNSSANYRSALGDAATRSLNTALANMLGVGREKVPGLAVIAFKDGKEVYRNMMGESFYSRSNSAWNQPVTSTTLFRVASISKMFTAVGVMQLVEKGLISLDEDAGRYLGYTLRNPHFPDTPITVRMLLSHTSSFRDSNESYSNFYDRNSAGLKSVFSPTGQYYNPSSSHYAPAGEAPGKYFSYCNTNYIFLGDIIERISGERFDHYMKKHVFEPLDVKGTFSLYELSDAGRQNVGTIYRASGGSYQATVDDRPLSARDLSSFPAGRNTGVFGPQGNLRCSAEDLSHLLLMFMNGGTYNGKKVLSSASVDQMSAPVWRYNGSNTKLSFNEENIESYGYAMQQLPGAGRTRPVKDRSYDLVGHFGEAYGFIGGVLWHPGTKDGFIFFQNGGSGYTYENPGRYSINTVWEENFMTAIINNIY